MKTKLESFEIKCYYQSIMYKKIVLSATKKDALEYLGVTIHTFNNYGSGPKMNPPAHMLQHPAGTVFALFDRSGEAPYFVIEQNFETPILETEAKQIIEAHRRICKTHTATIEWDAKGRVPSHEVGCGYCKHEKSCPIRVPKINKARNCHDFKHYSKS